MKVPLCCSDQNRPMVATTAATPCAEKIAGGAEQAPRDSTQSELVKNLDNPSGPDRSGSELLAEYEAAATA